MNLQTNSVFLDQGGHLPGRAYFLASATIRHWRVCRRSLCILFAALCLLTLSTVARGRTIDLREAKQDTLVLQSYQGNPDKAGIFEIFDLQIPSFERGVYYRGPWFPYGGNRMHGNIITKPAGATGGLFVVLQIAADDYLAVLPLVGDETFSYFRPTNDKFQVVLSNAGTASVQGDVPVVTWARAESPYQATQQVWKQARHVEQTWMKLRHEKSYPEMFKYLGWCSWEGYRGKITSDKMVSALENLRDGAAPVRWFLVDDGHFDRASLAPHPKKFPAGYHPLTERRSEDAMRWVGMWHAMLGTPSGTPKGHPKAIRDAMMQAPSGRMVPKPNRQDMTTFLDYLFQHSIDADIDFLKIDFYGSLLPIYAGTKRTKAASPLPKTNARAIENPSKATTTFARVMQQRVQKHFDGLINCNWHVAHFIFNSGDSVVGRCSADYSVGNLGKAKSHLYHSYLTSLWLGQVAWPDHDMFHSNDPVAGRMMAISKAMSGGPVYLSDRPDELKLKHIKPLCYEDGRLPRPIAPATPVPEDLFHKRDNNQLYRVMAPLPNHSAAFALYNFNGRKDSNKPSRSATIAPKHYRAASGMIQPYPGPWSLPDEGLIVYDHSESRARKLGDGYEVTIDGFGNRLVQLSPVRHGWSVIGRTDKFLAAATVELIKASPGELKVKLHETGPFALWLDEGQPQAPGVTFRAKGNGLYRAELPVKEKPRTITISRKD